MLRMTLFVFIIDLNSNLNKLDESIKNNLIKVENFIKSINDFQIQNEDFDSKINKYQSNSFGFEISIDKHVIFGFSIKVCGVFLEIANT